MKRDTVIAIASMMLSLAGGLSATAQQQQPAGLPAGERLRDMNLTEAQEAAIADIREDYQPKVEDAASQLSDVLNEERDAARAVLTPEQQTKLNAMKDQRKAWRYETSAERMAHLRDLDLTDEEMKKLTDIRKEYRPKIAKALEEAKGILTPEQAKMREEGLKAGKPRKEVLESLNLTDDQKAKWEAAGTQVRGLVKEQLSKMRDVLDPEQREKLDAMKDQRRDQFQARAMFAAENIKDLNLTEDQKTQLGTIQKQYGSRVEEAGNKLRAVIREEMREIIGVIKT
jgi:Spy/CpxP family protein refolding chaperone